MRRCCRLPLVRALQGVREERALRAAGARRAPGPGGHHRHRVRLRRAGQHQVSTATALVSTSFRRPPNHCKSLSDLTELLVMFPALCCSSSRSFELETSKTAGWKSGHSRMYQGQGPSQSRHSSFITQVFHRIQGAEPSSSESLSSREFCRSFKPSESESPSHMQKQVMLL